MKRIVIAIVAVLTATTAQAWDITDMNRAISQTNFIVNGGCSGTLVSIKERIILTNHHCVDDRISVVERDVLTKGGSVRKKRERKYADVPVAQHDYDGFIRLASSSFLTDIVAEDQRRDLAALRFKGPISHTYASPLVSDDVVRRGERVYAVGNPAGADATVVEGIVSNVNRTFEFDWTDGARLPMIQFSGGIWGGNSGGALYNARGELIGVPAAMNSRANFIGLAIPISVVKAFLRDYCLARVFDADASADDAKCRSAVERERRKAEGRG